MVFFLFSSSRYITEEAIAAEQKANSPTIGDRDKVFSTVPVSATSLGAGGSGSSGGSNGGGSSNNIGVINNNGRSSTSPVASRGSASSDPWPSQSDEDIDRLVALHRNRNSLSSLGVCILKLNNIQLYC